MTLALFASLAVTSFFWKIFPVFAPAYIIAKGRRPASRRTK